MTQQRMGWGLLVGVVSAIATIGQLPVQANTGEVLVNISHPVLNRSDLDADATAVEGRSAIDAATLAQSVTQVVGVQVNPTETGVAITLETAAGGLALPSTMVVGNALIADIPNAMLVLPEGDEFQRVNPVDGIAFVSVTANGDGIRVAVTGTDAPPAVDVQSAAQGLILSVVPSAEAATETEEDSIQIVVTGETDEDSYVETDVTTATRTDTPLRDIPQSIQVIPQEVLEDQQVIRLGDALRNVSGVGTVYDPRGARYIIRGFSSSSVLRDGFRLTNGFSGNSGFPELANIEQVEVLKGPAAILFGAAEPGGSINLITEQPLSDPLYELGLRIGNRTLFEPSIDLSGPLTEDERVLYRLNALYRTEESFRNFESDIKRFFIAPIVSVAISDRTTIIFDFEYRDDEQPADFGLIAVGDAVADIPFDRILGEPEDIAQSEFLRTGYQLEHRLSESWKLRNAFHYTSYDTEFISANANFGQLDEATGILFRNFLLLDQPSDTFELQTNVVGEFSTGSIEHTLLAGIDLFRREDFGSIGRGDFSAFAPINIFNPVYGATPRPDFTQEPIFFNSNTRVDSLGIYLQDQIELLDNLNVLVGIRYETVTQENTNFPSFFNPESSETSQTDDAFSPRIGLVYQPIEELSLFTSYSQAFFPNSATTVTGDLLEPERSKQFEIGARAELLDGRFIASLAYFNIVKENVATPDPDFPFFSVAAGQQQSQGLELDLIGEIAPGWNLIANYALIEAEITEDNSGLEGNRLFGVPRNNFNLWTTYEIQTGSLQGLGFGLGVNYVGERFGDDANSFELDSYFLTNAAIFYERDNWQVGLNIRNLFDVEYIEGTENSRTAEIYPGEPFTIVGSVSVNF